LNLPAGGCPQPDELSARSIIIHFMDVIEILRPPVGPRTRPLVDQLATLDHPELASVLAGLDRRSLSGEHLLEVVLAGSMHVTSPSARPRDSSSDVRTQRSSPPIPPPPESARAPP